MAEIKTMGRDRKFPVEGELCKRIIELVHEYDGEIGLASVIGVLDLVKDAIKGDCADV